MPITLTQLLSRFLRPRAAKRHPIVSSRVASRGAPRRGPGRLDLLVLEDRAVPALLVSQVLGGTGSITGTVYDDQNGDGIRNNGENGVAGWTVYLDLDGSGTLNTDAVDATEPSAVTNVDGIFTVRNLQAGTYRLAEVMQSGWEATAPLSQDVGVVSGKSSKAANFLNFSGGAIAGTVWNDLNGDGVRATDGSGTFTDPGLSGWTVFLDLNNSGAADAGEPVTVTDATGRYQFTNLPAGDYEVTEVQPGGVGAWDIPPGPWDIKQTASVRPRTTVTQDFANFSLTNGAIQGTVWGDLNANGVRDTDPDTGAFTEPGLVGWTVFLDGNANGVLDAGEMNTVTDADGKYQFVSLPEGSYEVTEVIPSGWDIAAGYDTRQTVDVFAGEVATATDFVNFSVDNGSLHGTVWNDLNRNGVRDTNLAGAFTDPGLAGWTVFIDLNHNGIADGTDPTTRTDTAGNYAFTGLQVGDYDVTEVVPTGWETTVGHGDNATVRVYSGSDTAVPDFANFNLATATAGSVSGTVWNDLNANGARDKNASGAYTDLGMSGWTVFVDLNSNGVLDATDPTAVTAADGSYTITGVMPGSVTVIEQVKAGWRATAPASAIHTFTLRNADAASGLDFGDWTVQDSSIRGTVFADLNRNGTSDAGEGGLAGVTVYLDSNNNGTLDAGELSTTTSQDLFYTPGTDEAGSYAFTHLAAGDYTVRVILPAILSATPADQMTHTVTVSAAASATGVDTAARYRPTELRGVKFDDLNGNGARDAGESGVGGVTVFVDLNRNDALDAGELTAVTAADGSYSFTGLSAGAYVVRELVPAGYERTYPTTTGGILWPTGTSNAAVGIVTPTSITTSLATGATFRQTVSLTLPNSGALTNMVDVFLLFDDTGSFANNSPIVRAAFPDIMAQLQASLPGIDLGFGVGRFEEYANFAAEYATGRPFVLNQPIVAASMTGYMTAIQAALNRTTPGYGGDQPETDIEALYQLVTGAGFDGNNNGSVLDSGAAGLAATQLNPGSSGDVPSFASFTADPTNGVMAAAGNVGGGGFRAGALPIVLLATDTGFAFQPKGETSVTGVGGVSVPVSALTQTSRPTTPFNSGAGLQQTVTALNSLGALVIGLGTNTQTNVDPRQGLEALSKLTGAVNRSAAGIPNGTGTPIAPGDPLYFEIASGFASSVAPGVVSAIQNAATTVAMDITVQASDPRVRIINHTGTRTGVGSGQTASFDIEFVGDGIPHRFDLQFVRAGTNVILGSIPVVIGTPIIGNCYEFEDLEDGEHRENADFGSHLVSTAGNPTVTVTGGTFTYDGTAYAASATVTGTGAEAVSGTTTFTYNGSATPPTNAGTYAVVATFTSADPHYTNGTGTGSITINSAMPTVSATGGTVTYDASAHPASATVTGAGGATVSGTTTFTYYGSAAVPTNAGTYAVVATFSSADGNYANATGTATLTITSVAPSFSALGGTFTYDAIPHAASATATGVGGVAVSGTTTFTYNGSATTPTAAGTYAVVATFTSADGNYTDASDTTTLIITSATPTVSVTGGTFVFDGNSHAASAVVTGVGGATVSGTTTFTYNGSATAPAAAGVYAVAATFTSADPNYANASGSATLTISAQLIPTLCVTGGTFTYDGAAHAASATATGTGGAAVGGTFAFTYNGSATAPTNAGTYTVVATFTSADPNYTSATGTGSITINSANPTVSVTGGTFVFDGNAHAASAVVTGVGGATVSGTTTFTYNGSATSPTAVGTYTVVATFASADGNYATATGTATLTITATGGTITVTGTSVSATAGAPFTKAVATFGNLDPSRPASSYTAVITWGDGTTSIGVVSGSGATLTVTGTHTYADPGSDTIRVTVSDNLGTATAGSAASTATVTALGQDAGKTKESKFWNSAAGQALIKSFNGGVTHTELATWLATNFANLYGAGAGANNLTGKTNADVAALFQRLWATGGDGANAQILATALNVYATTSSLGGTQGAGAGFTVSAAGHGARSFNVRSYGAAVGVANGTKLNVFQLLKAVNARAVNGMLYNGNAALIGLAKDLFDELNTI